MASPSGQTPVTGLHAVAFSLQLQNSLHSTPHVYSSHTAGGQSGGRDRQKRESVSFFSYLPRTEVRKELANIVTLCVLCLGLYSRIVSHSAVVDREDSSIRKSGSRFDTRYLHMGHHHSRIHLTKRRDREVHQSVDVLVYLLVAPSSGQVPFTWLQLVVLSGQSQSKEQFKPHIPHGHTGSV